MSQTLNEQLSAALDGELPADQYDLLLRRLDADPELREKFARYSLAGDAFVDGRIEADALGVADRVREQIAGMESPADESRQAGRSGVAAGVLGAGIAAAAALVLALNLNPTPVSESGARIAGTTPLPPQSGASDAIAAVEPERMTRYLLTHSDYANAASRQFVDSHVVMPAFRRAGWQTTGASR
jgi:negative regulator of sigma E activity